MQSDTCYETKTMMIAESLRRIALMTLMQKKELIFLHSLLKPLPPSDLSRVIYFQLDNEKFFLKKLRKALGPSSDSFFENILLEENEDVNAFHSILLQIIDHDNLPELEKLINEYLSAPVEV